jgi:hypothetical protein
MLVLSGVALLAIIVSDFLVPPAPEEQFRILRHEMNELRLAADSCREAVEREEAELQAIDARFDSLKARIDYFERLDPRGVPADSYDAYLDVFEAYNAGIPERSAAGDTLEAHYQACRELVRRHNQIADSARALAAELGLLRDSLGDESPR